MSDARELDEETLRRLPTQLREWGEALGFSQIGIADVDLSSAEAGLMAWLRNGFHGGMGYMAAHGVKRARPAELVPGTVRVITARMDYLPRTSPGGWQAIEWQRIGSASQASISVYARGRDYHKVLRSRLQKLAEQLAEAVGPLGHRVFTDSAPVLEVELASRSGIGWRGKHRWRCTAKAARCFFWARSMWTWRCRCRSRCHRIAAPAALASTCARRRPSSGPTARRAALHLVPDDRTRRPDPGGAAPADRQPHLRLRRLPARLPVE